MWRMDKYQSFYHSVLKGLKNVSSLQLDAFTHWITEGNISHLHPDTEIYPNVSLTCLNPMLEMGQSLYQKERARIKGTKHKGI